MTTPNIEELMARAKRLRNELDDSNARLDRQCVTAMYEMEQALQSQAERIKVIERESEMRRIALHEVMLEADQLRTQLAESISNHEACKSANTMLLDEIAAIAATEPVLVVEKEPDYWSGGHFHEGSKPHIKPTKVWCLPIGTQLFTRPMPAQDVTELVEALEKLARLGNGEHYGNSDGNMIARNALYKYKGAK